MFPWTGTPHQTNGASANYFGVGSAASTATAVPVATVRENVLVAPRGLIQNFSPQAHSLGSTSGFAPAAQFASPMVRTHESLGSVYPALMHSRASQVRPINRSQSVFSATSPAPAYAAPVFSSNRGGQILWDVSRLSFKTPTRYRSGMFSKIN